MKTLNINSLTENRLLHRQKFIFAVNCSQFQNQNTGK